MKKIFIIAIVSGKSVKIFIGLKKTCLGVLDTRDRDKDNEIGLKKGRVIKIEITVGYSRAAPSLDLLTIHFNFIGCRRVRGQLSQSFSFTKRLHYVSFQRDIFFR